MSDIRVAVVGVGNCCSSLVQGVHFYKDADPAGPPVPGLMNVRLGGYHVKDVRFVAAFDVDAGKVGRGLNEAVFALPNNTFRFATPPGAGVTVLRGPTLDGIGEYTSHLVRESGERPCDVTGVLRESGAEVLVNYLPVGSEEATCWYAERALEAGCAFVNCIPVFIASRPEWAERFRDHGLPLIGDDVKSQVGATIVHRELVNLFRTRGVRLDRTYQLNFGGNTDFLNMLERSRLESKKVSKTRAVTSQLGVPLPADDVHVGPSDFVPWLGDRKFCHVRMEGTGFGGVPTVVEVKLEVWDSPNSAGVVIDAVRFAKMALDAKLSGAVHAPSAYLMKSPPEQVTDDAARNMCLAFVRRYGGTE